MSTESRVLLNNVSLEAADSTYTYGEKRKGAGYNRRSDGLHTVIYEVIDFIGSIKIQGTLEMYPADSDWVDIAGTEIGLGDDSTAWTTTNTRNFTGNFVWIRAAYNLHNGIITAIRYNH
jgi:hypothetical protein